MQSVSASSINQGHAHAMQAHSKMCRWWRCRTPDATPRRVMCRKKIYTRSLYLISTEASKMLVINHLNQSAALVVPGGREIWVPAHEWCRTPDVGHTWSHMRDVLSLVREMEQRGTSKNLYQIYRIYTSKITDGL